MDALEATAKATITGMLSKLTSDQIKELKAAYQSSHSARPQQDIPIVNQILLEMPYFRQMATVALQLTKANKVPGLTDKNSQLTLLHGVCRKVIQTADKISRIRQNGPLFECSAQIIGWYNEMKGEDNWHLFQSYVNATGETQGFLNVLNEQERERQKKEQRQAENRQARDEKKRAQFAAAKKQEQRANIQAGRQELLQWAMDNKVAINDRDVWCILTTPRGEQYWNTNKDNLPNPVHPVLAVILAKVLPKEKNQYTGGFRQVATCAEAKAMHYWLTDRNVPDVQQKGDLDAAKNAIGTGGNTIAFQIIDADKAKVGNEEGIRVMGACKNCQQWLTIIGWTWTRPPQAT